MANHLGLVLDKLPEKLRHNAVLRAACGFTFESLVGIASYYDFINRIVRLDERPKLKLRRVKPKVKVVKGSKSTKIVDGAKLTKGQKLPPKNPGIVAKLVERILNKDENFANRPEKKLQEIFAGVSVRQSIELGLVPTDSLDIAGDGTCIETGASHRGVGVCECRSKGIYKCDCPRRFSDPSATWGWDSHKGVFFYGYTGYFISTYNKDLKADLPLYLRLVEASRHDSVSAVVALAEFRKLYPFLNINTFISDSASDNYATYELLHAWGWKAVIALNETNKGNFKYPPPIDVDDAGTPICAGGNKMVYWGFCGKDRCRLKWRCPKATGRLYNRNTCQSCSPSAYGRCIYTKPHWDLRIFTAIPRHSPLWKEKMKTRTCCERVNNRILNDYNIGQTRNRGKKRVSFLATIAATNIHLDVQLRTMKANDTFGLADLFRQSIAA